MTRQEHPNQIWRPRAMFSVHTPFFVMVAESEEALANGVANITSELKSSDLINDFRQVALLSDSTKLPHVQVSVITNARSIKMVYLCLTLVRKPFTKTLPCRRFSVLCVPF